MPNVHKYCGTYVLSQPHVFNLTLQEKTTGLLARSFNTIEKLALSEGNTEPSLSPTQVSDLLGDMAKSLGEYVYKPVQS